MLAEKEESSFTRSRDHAIGHGLNGTSIDRISAMIGGCMKHGHEEIAARAYEIWEREGRPANKAKEHWLRAQRELCGDGGAAASGASKPSTAGSSASGSVSTSEDRSHSADGCCGGRKMHGAHRHAGGRQGGRGDSKR